METLRLDTVVLDDDARAADDLTGVTLAVDLAKASPGAEHLGVTNFDEVDLVLGAEGLDELDVLGLSAGLDKDAEMGLALVEGLGTLAETTSETIMYERVLQDLLKSVLDGQFTLGGIGGDLDLGVGGLNLNFISSVRHLF